MTYDRTHRTPTMHFHVLRDARDRYKFDESLFSLTGNVIFANFHGARVFAQRMNQKRDLITFPEQAVKASQINALGLIHELTHYVFRSYREQQNPQVLEQALAYLNTQLGADLVDTALLKFVDEFPAPDVYKRETDAQSYLNEATAGMPNREIVLEEMLMLWVGNVNPAFSPFLELFDDSLLEKETTYQSIMTGLYDFFDGQPSVTSAIGGAAAGGDGSGGLGAAAPTAGSRTTSVRGSGQNLIDALRAPARAAPHSLEAQLEYISGRWGVTLGKYVYRLLGGLDLIKEEEKPVFFGPGPVEVPIFDFSGLTPEPENFSPDREWMPRLVLMAKNAYVWLEQLSRQYGQPITSLDQVPDEELDKLARWGVTGLWLIGLWERSQASQRMKQMMGNADAVASAYSLFDYQIAAKLGGEAASENLKQRAWQRGIRMASDMVPNHVGIDGRWVIEHPEWFISVDQSPYPSYTFNGPDLSWDEQVGIFLEDHYYDRSDAAVVFKRVDRASGQESYIYHGNDGTTMPWNDTAQLNYLQADLREAIIQTILNVARQFPVIRFDAAMTLAKKHVERLWFPEPGSGGAIASRSEHAMTKAEFDALMPNEFWREVVDRAAEEAPDTLLLAEAFWLMESYFVRTLGMHRVYNSAFMHLLRDEENAKYRGLMKNTLEFDPEILKRYVNFQNNPDERTAVDQFGKGDKYFGVCTLMLTMPGLPMFGHGQIEGFAEKYGMEYQRAYWDEHPDGYLIERHEREIFPLVHKRYLFADVDQFLLYDFASTDGSIAEDVFAYSNRHGDERGLVVYHNTYATVRGWIRTSTAFSVRTGNGEERSLIKRTLGEGLGLTPADGGLIVFRDQVTGLEYIRSIAELSEQGLYIELEAYKCQVFLDFREVRDDPVHQYSQLAGFLAGRGVPSVDEALKELFLQPIHYPFKELVNADMFRQLLAARATPPVAPPETDTQAQKTKAAADTNGTAPAAASAAVPAAPAAPAEPAEPTDHAALLDAVEEKMLHLLREIKQFTESTGDETAIAREVRSELAAILQLPALDTTAKRTGDELAAIKEVQADLADNTGKWGTLFGWLFVHALGKLTGAADFAEQSRSWVDEWLLGRIISGTLRDLGVDEQQANLSVAVIKQLTSYQSWFETPELDYAYQLLETLLADSEIQQLLRVNRHQGTLWFDKHAFEQLLGWMLASALASSSAEASDGISSSTIGAFYRTITQLRAAGEESGYQIEKLKAIVQV